MCSVSSKQNRTSMSRAVPCRTDGWTSWWTYTHKLTVAFRNCFATSLKSMGTNMAEDMSDVNVHLSFSPVCRNLLNGWKFESSVKTLNENYTRSGEKLLRDVSFLQRVDWFTGHKIRLSLLTTLRHYGEGRHRSTHSVSPHYMEGSNQLRTTDRFVSG